MRKKRILIALLAVLVFVFNFQISFASEADKTVGEPDTSKPSIARSLNEPGNIQFGDTRELTFKQNKDVEVDIIRKNPPLIEDIFETKDKEIIFMLDASRTVVPPAPPEGDPFSYALFAGSDDKDSKLNLSGNKFILEGDCHSNNDIVVGVGRAKSILDGQLRHVGSYEQYDPDIKTIPVGNTDKDVVKKDVVKIDMPDLSKNFNTTDAIRFSYDALSTSGEKLYKRYLEPGSDYLLSKYGDELKVSYDVHAKTWNLDGETLKLNEEKPYFFNGNVIISVDNVVGNGTIVAEDDITFNPGTLGKSEVGLYSIYGGIVCNLAPGGVFTGLLYAPGIEKPEYEPESGLVPGSIAVRSLNFEYNGSIVGKSLDLTGDKVIKYVRTKVHDDFSDPDVDNEFLNQTKDKVKKVIDDLALEKGSNIKTATILYSDHAEVIGSEFITTSKGADVLTDEEKEKFDDYIDKIGKISEKDGCNLGDGLRLAYHLFKNDGKEDADKYLVVFSYNELDKYTVITGTDDFRTEDGDKIEEKDITSSVKDDKAKAVEYAKTVAKMIDSKYKGVYFVDIKPGEEHLSDLSDIAKDSGAKKVGEYYCYNPEEDTEKDKSYMTRFAEDVAEIYSELVVPNKIKVGEKEIPVPDTVIDYDVKVRFGIVEKDATTGEDKITYSNKLPEGVQFISSSDLTADASGTLDFVDGFASKVIKKVIKDKESNPIKLTATIPELKVNIKFNKIGDFEFKLAKLVYEFTNKEDPEDTVIVPVDIEPLKVNVGWKIDIN